MERAIQPKQKGSSTTTSIKSYKTMQTGCDVVLEASKVVLTPVVTNQVYKMTENIESNGARIAISCGAGIVTYISLELARRATVNHFEKKIQEAYINQDFVQHQLTNGGIGMVSPGIGYHNQIPGMTPNMQYPYPQAGYMQYPQNLIPVPQELLQTQTPEQAAVAAFNNDVVLQPTTIEETNTNA